MAQYSAKVEVPGLLTAMPSIWPVVPIPAASIVSLPPWPMGLEVMSLLLVGGLSRTIN